MNIYLVYITYSQSDLQFKAKLSLAFFVMLKLFLMIVQQKFIYKDESFKITVTNITHSIHCIKLYPHYCIFYKYAFFLDGI